MNLFRTSYPSARSNDGSGISLGRGGTGTDVVVNAMDSTLGMGARDIDAADFRNN